MKVAFLGLGRMGREMAGHLLGDHELTVWNRTAAAADDLVARGATRADAAAEAVAGADAVVTMLAGPEALAEVVLDPPLPIPAGSLWVDATTVAPADTDTSASWAARRGVRYVHAPVAGTVGPARAGTLGVLLGGEPDAVEAARPLALAWGDPERVRTFDAPAKAATAKLVTNLTLFVAAQGVVEALRLGRSGGLAVEEILAILDTSMIGGVVKQKADTMRSGDFGQAQFSAALMAKDARLMTHTSALPLPAVTALFESLSHAVRTGHGDDDYSVITAPEL